MAKKANKEKGSRTETENDEYEKESVLSDVIKKVVSIGVGAAFMTEDAVRNLISDLPLPKDIVTGLVSNAKNVKEEFSQNMKEEVRNFLSQIDTKNLMDHIAKNYDFEINATVKLKPKKSNQKESESES